MAERLYAAYGSNLNVRQMMYRCPHAHIIGTSSVNRYRLLFKGSKTGSYLTIEKDGRSSVPVAIWGVDEYDELALDRYEGFPVFYYKKEMKLPVTNLYTGETTVETVFIYIMHEDRKIGVPSRDYMRTCLTGYNYFKFPTNKLITAYEYSRKKVNAY